MIKNEIYISLNIIILHSIDSRYNPRKNIYTGSSRSYIKKKKWKLQWTLPCLWTINLRLGVKLRGENVLSNQLAQKTSLPKYGGHHQWRTQEFRLGGARLKDKIENKKLI